MTNYEQVRNVKKPSAAIRQQQQPSKSTDHGLTRQQHPAAIIQRATAAPESLTTADLLQLQRTIGNRAVGQLLSGINAGQRESLAHGSLIQAKLTINPPGDIYEQEADRVAGQVVDRINQPAGPGQAVQRQEMPEEEEELLQGKMIDAIQRQDIPEEEEELQMMPVVQRAPGSGIAATPDLEAAIQQARGSGQPLSRGIRAPMEQAFGADFGGVRVHTDTESDLLNRSIQAQAFTTGQDIFFRHGAYDPGSRGGQELLAHEMTHVVQQNATLQKQLANLKGDPVQRLKLGVTNNAGGGVVQPAYTARRQLGGLGWLGKPWVWRKRGNIFNLGLYHEHIFFNTPQMIQGVNGGNPIDNIGFFNNELRWNEGTGGYAQALTGLDDGVIATAVHNNRNPGNYSLLFNNCQRWVAKVLKSAGY
ncbi:MAG: hypothetical protein C4B59_06250 [Candidatus Methanogaster sp.]|uniref:Uncharacterized protein n=1 Tax=Candidatus Methanogaster sp. TaxID=3386292 RepID=A0AC61L3T9_9EURY|nr:MAG: hypothetical protein C4B59_06250 [ANME-2 cluster archaeon]